ncbi:MAG: 50S ribosomal protein L9 [Verrucomicrobia bacterium]|nr:MAG: 50S ribosomal protein L9 [Verrucomicrobiota bacterium]
MAKEVLLMTDVPGLGQEGDVVRVADGYLRNFLMPKKLAAPLTDATKRQVEKKRQTRDQKLAAERSQMTELAQKIEQLSVTIAVKTGEEGKLFGSVTVQDILAAVEQQGLKLDRHQVQLDEPLRKLGKFDLPVKVHPEVQATLKVWIVEE